MEIEVNEIWKDIEGFKNYQVSNLGRIKSKKRITNAGIKNSKQITRKEKILKPLKITKGYLGIILYKDGIGKTFKVHRLVAQAFIPNSNNLPQVNHKDGNKENNRVDNLEWCTCKENMKHSYKTGLRDMIKIKENMRNVGKMRRGKEGNHKRKVLQIDVKTNKEIKVWEYQIEAAKRLNISNTSIQNVCAGRSKTAGGFIWKYV